MLFKIHFCEVENGADVGFYHGANSSWRTMLRKISAGNPTCFSGGSTSMCIGWRCTRLRRRLLHDQNEGKDTNDQDTDREKGVGESECR